MEKTNFAGITRLGPGEPLSTDDFAFQGADRAIIDHLLRIGAIAHRHDGRPALAQPATVPTVEVFDAGGTIPADTEIHVTFSYVDDQGGETLPYADPVVITTLGGLAEPDIEPTVELDHAAGTLLADNYRYAVTVTDDGGGQTTLGPAASVTVPPGFPSSQITVSGLAAIVAASGGSGWKLWRMIGSGRWVEVASGSALTDEVLDDGTLCPDCSSDPPLTTGTTAATNRLRVTIPTPLPDGVTAVRIYASEDGTFSSPSLLGQYADVAAPLDFPALDVLAGAPLDRATAIGGANQIDPDTDLVDFPWKRPVTDASALPAAGNTDGDVRMSLDNGHLHQWVTDAWIDRSAGGGGGAGHTIEDEGVAMNARAKLNFSGSGVTVTDDLANDRTVVTIPGGGSAADLDLGENAAQWVDPDGNIAARMWVEQAEVLEAGVVDEEFTSPTSNPWLEGGTEFTTGLGALIPNPDGTGAGTLVVKAPLYDKPGGIFGGGKRIDMLDCDLNYGYTARTADWSQMVFGLHFSGDTIPPSKRGVFVIIDKDLGELRLVLDANGDETYQVLATLGPPWTPPAPSEEGYLTIVRRGNLWTITDERSVGVGSEVVGTLTDIAIPAEHEAEFGAGTRGFAAIGGKWLATGTGPESIGFDYIWTTRLQYERDLYANVRRRYDTVEDQNDDRKILLASTRPVGAERTWTDLSADLASGATTVAGQEPSYMGAGWTVYLRGSITPVDASDALLGAAALPDPDGRALFIQTLDTNGDHVQLQIGTDGSLTRSPTTGATPIRLDGISYYSPAAEGP